MNQGSGEKGQESASGGRPAAVERVGTLTRAADGREFTLGFGSLRVGRQRRADLVIDDKTVSRHHADICYESGRYVLYDHSANGTWVNDVVVAVAHHLRDNDRVRFGQAEFVFSHKPMERRAGARSLEQTAARRVEDTETLIVKGRGKSPARKGLLALIVMAVVAAAVAVYFLFL
ncbi:MAG: FHA domain-containing protein [Gemmatimonadota bacterium]|nr:MAG: FHA domain-containing protein [Gemmatimonadota bacterium]